MIKIQLFNLKDVAGIVMRITSNHFYHCAKYNSADEIIQALNSSEFKKVLIQLGKTETA